MKNRQIVLDTETTGINKLGVHYEGHKIIEIGAVEIVNRRLTGNHFHTYLRPNRSIDPEAYKIHGISEQSLSDKPMFAEVVADFLDFIKNSELIIHNASFDVGFLNYELDMLNNHFPKLETLCQITDSLQMARKLFPGKRNNLDILCERYQIDNQHRTLHGALLDAQLLAEVYLAMTGGQTSLSFNNDLNLNIQGKSEHHVESMYELAKLKVLHANDEENSLHEQQLTLIEQNSGRCLWRI